MTTAPRHRFVALAVATLAAVSAFAASPVLAADGVATLGSPPPEETQDVAVAAPEDPMDAMLEFAACMRENGVDMPDPSASGDGFVMVIETTTTGSMDDPAGLMDGMFLAAEEACREHLGSMTSGGDPALDAEIMEALLAHADCMRDQGIDMPDPEMTSGTVVIGPPDADGIDFFSEEYMAAEEACREVMPFEGFGVGGATQ